MAAENWIYEEMKTCELPPDAACAFHRALEGFVGARYSPVLYVARRSGKGTDYCIVCRTVTATNPPLTGCKAVFLYSDAQGSAAVVKIEDIL